MITAGIRVKNSWHVAEFYLDSGAAYTLMHSQFADRLSFDYAAGKRILVQVGDGSFIPVFLHRLTMQIGGKRFDTTVGFSNRLGVRFHLLGRYELFEHFKICFHEKQRAVFFHPLT